jgi:hypothetical protein
MQRDISIQMPTDLHSTDISPLELDSLPPKAKGLVRLTVNIPATTQPETSLTRPRWKTPEFILYYVMALIVIPIMIWVPISLSSSTHVQRRAENFDSFFDSASHPNFPYYRRRLSRGWLFGRDIVSPHECENYVGYGSDQATPSRTTATINIVLFEMVFLR